MFYMLNITQLIMTLSMPYQFYYGEYRRAKVGKWNAEENFFEHWRYKFGFRLDTCNHFEDDNGFASFVPIRLANEAEIEEYLNTK